MISIVMATYNGETYIREQINSILNQTISDFELIISDDCSKDSTVEIIKRYKDKDKRITLVENEKNLGFKKNFEKAISYCKGDFIAFCDQDDIWTEDHLEILHNEIGDKDLICGNAELVDQNGNSMNLTTYQCLSEFDFPGTNTDLFKKLLYGNFAQGTALMISNTIVKDFLPMPECAKYHDWWAASIACLKNGCKYTDKIVLKYRQHGNNQTVTKKYNIFASIKNALEKKAAIKLEYKEKIAYAEELLKRTDNPDFVNSISEAKNYYELLLCKSLKAIKYFKKNYSSIYWVRNPSKKLYLLRFFKVFILHI